MVQFPGSTIHPLHRSLAPVRRAVVHHPEHSIRRAVDRPLHHLLDQSPERLDSCLGLAEAHHQPLLNVPGRQILQRPATLVFRFDSPTTTWGRPKGRVTADAGLDAGLLVRADDPVKPIDSFALPVTLVQIQDDGGLLEEVGGTGENPVLVLPGLDGVLVEDAPDGAAADGLVQLALDPFGEIGRGLAAQRVSGASDHITGDRCDNGPVKGGKRPACGPGQDRPRR